MKKSIMALARIGYYIFHFQKFLQNTLIKINMVSRIKVEVFFESWEL